MSQAIPRVLIVDDEPRNLSLLEALLSSFSIEVTRASGGQEGIDLYRAEVARGGFDLVLLDVMMPDVDLSEALEDARSGAARLRSLIAALIDVEKAETGQLVVTRKVTSAHKLLDGVARRHSKDAEARSVTISVQADESLQVDVDADL